MDLKSSPSGHLVMKVDDFTNSKVKTKQTAYTLHASKGEPHLLEEHDESNETMEDTLTRDRARANWPWPWDEKPAANAAGTYVPNREERRAANAAELFEEVFPDVSAAGVGSSTDPAPMRRRMLIPRREPSPTPAANAAPPPPPPSWFDPEQRETMLKSHECMMTVDHTHLDYKVK